jgi:hypothetical protein
MVGSANEMALFVDLLPFLVITNELEESGRLFLEVSQALVPLGK